MKEFRNLGRTGIKVSNLCLGCMNFGGKTDADHAARVVDRFLDEGLNFIDTANVYHRGVSEDYLGRALSANGKRDRVVLATKVHAPMADDDPNMMGNTRRHIVQQCEASLKRLQTDWIDLYQIHRPQSSIPIDETLRALDDLIRSGKVRYIGTSTFAGWQIVESLWVSKELGLNRFVCEQPPYNLMDRRIEREVIPAARTFGIALIPWSPLAGGFLTGKYKRGEAPPEGARLQDTDSGRGKRLFSDAGFDVLETAETLASQKGCTVSQLALAWCAAQPGVTSPIIGPRNVEQLDDNLGALDVEITEADNEAIDRVSLPGGYVAPYFEADFGPHDHRPW